MKPVNRCPKCENEKVQPVTQDAKVLYCTNCQHTWKKGKERESLNEKHEMGFNGVMPAAAIINNLRNSTDLSDEMAAALTAQITGTLFEQWYEGFKTGLLAQVVANKEKNNDDGKTRSESGARDRERRDGDSETGDKQHKNCGPIKSTGSTSEAFTYVKEKVGGFILERRADSELTGLEYESLAANIVEWESKFGLEVEGVKYDGVRIQITAKV